MLCREGWPYRCAQYLFGCRYDMGASRLRWDELRISQFRGQSPSSLGNFMSFLELGRWDCREGIRTTPAPPRYYCNGIRGHQTLRSSIVPCILDKRRPTSSPEGGVLLIFEWFVNLFTNLLRMCWHLVTSLFAIALEEFVASLTHPFSPFSGLLSKVLNCIWMTVAMAFTGTGIDKEKKRWSELTLTMLARYCYSTDSVIEIDCLLPSSSEPPILA